MSVSEKLKNNALNDALIYIVSSILNSLIPFLLIPILTRYLSPAEFGMIAIFQAVVAILNVFVGIGLHGSIRVRYFKHKREFFSRYVGVSILILLISASLMILVGILLFYEIKEVTGLPPLYLYMGFIISITQFLIQIRLVIWQVKSHSLQYGVFQVSQTFFNVLLSLYFVIGLSLGAQGRVIGISAASIVFCFLAVCILFVRKEVLITWNKNDAISAIKFGLPLIPHAVTGIVITMSDRFILVNKIGMDSVGLYFIALQLSLPVSIISESLNRAFMPWSYKKMGNGDNYRVVAATYLMMLFFLIFSGIYAVCIWFGFDLIIDADYHSSMKITMILLAASCFQAFYFPIAKSIFFSEKTISLSILTVCLGTLYVASALEVVNQYGMVGLAFTYLLYRMSVFFFVWLLGNYLHPLPWLNVKKVSNECYYLSKNLLFNFQDKISFNK